MWLCAIGISVPAMATLLFQVGVNDFDQLLGGVGLERAWIFLWIDQVRTDVVFNHLGHQAGNGAADSGDHVHDPLAPFLILERALDGLDLAADAAHPPEQLFFFTDGVAHPPYIAYPPILVNANQVSRIGTGMPARTLPHQRYESDLQ